MSTRKHYAALDGFRGVAALAVLALHIALQFNLPEPVHAGLAVDFFFGLSGFVIAHAYDRAFSDGRMKFWSFFWRRVIRLWPMILIGVALGTASMWVSAAHNGQQSTSQVALLGVLAAVLVPGGIAFGLQAFPVNTPLWSLFFEGLANIAYGLDAAANGPRRPSGALLLSTAMFLAAVAAIYAPITKLGFWHGYWFIGGLARVTYPFLAGILIRRSGVYLKVPKIPDYALAAILVAVLLAPSTRFDQAFDLVAVLVVFPFIIAAGAQESSSPAADRAWIVLGELSYPLYAIHQPVLRFALKAQNHLVAGTSPWVIAAMASAASVATAWVALIALDRPIRTWLQAPARSEPRFSSRIGLPIP